ncbi:hypothetical protein JCM1840_005575 [Sporobolomyces johnsonii]
MHSAQGAAPSTSWAGTADAAWGYAYSQPLPTAEPTTLRVQPTTNAWAASAVATSISDDTTWSYQQGYPPAQGYAGGVQFDAASGYAMGEGGNIAYRPDAGGQGQYAVPPSYPVASTSTAVDPGYHYAAYHAQPVSQPPQFQPMPSPQPYPTNPPPPPHANPSASRQAYAYLQSTLSAPPVPAQNVDLSATAQRFQNTPDSSSSSMPIPLAQSASPAHSAPYTHPTPMAVQQYTSKVDEAALIQQRISQLEGLLKRGTFAETGPGANQLITAEQRVQVEAQVRDLKNRELSVITECDSFIRQHGTAQVWRALDQVRTAGPHSPAGVPSQLPARPASSGSLQQQGPGQAHMQQAYVPHQRVQSYPQQTWPPSRSSPQRFPSSTNPSSSQQPQQQQQQQHAQATPSSEAPWAILSQPYAHHPVNGIQIQPQHYPEPINQFAQPVSQPPPPSYLSTPSTLTPQYGFPPQSLQPQQPQQPQQTQQQLPPPQQQAYGSSSSSSAAARPPPPHQQHAGFPSDQGHPAAPLQPPSGPSFPPGLQAQMAAFAREQAQRSRLLGGGAGNARRGSFTGGGAGTTPLRALIKKAETGEMPVLTLTGFKKASEVEAEKKAQATMEKRQKEMTEKAKMGGGAHGSRNGAPNENGREKAKHPTVLLAEMSRSGGPTLSELINSVKPQQFWQQLQQVCSKRGIPIFEEVQRGAFVIEGKPIDLLTLWQTVIGKGRGYEKVDLGNAWPHVASLLSLPPRSSSAHSRLKEIYHHILAPLEDAWAAGTLQEREKEQAMSEARRVLGANGRPASASATHGQGQEQGQGQGRGQGQGQGQGQPQSFNLPPNAFPQSSNPHSNSHPSPGPGPAPPPTHFQLPPAPLPPPAPSSAASSTFGNPLSFAPQTTSSPSFQFSAPQTTASPSLQLAAPPLPPPQQQQPQPTQEKPLTSADLLEQARALRRTTASTPTTATRQLQSQPQLQPQLQPQPPPQAQLQPQPRPPPQAQVQSQPATSPPQETSSTPQEPIAAPAPGPMPAKPSPSSTSDHLRAAVAAAGQIAPFSIGTPTLGRTASTSGGTSSASRKRKKEDEPGVDDEGGREMEKKSASPAELRQGRGLGMEPPTKERAVENGMVAPFDISQFVPPPLGSAMSSRRGSIANSRLRPNTGSTSASTMSPLSSIGDAPLPVSGPSTDSTSSSSSSTKAAPPSVLSNANSNTSTASPFDLGISDFSTLNSSNFPSASNPSSTLSPTSLDSLSLSLSLSLHGSTPDPHDSHASSWSTSDLGGGSSFDPFGGLERFEFGSTSFAGGSGLGMETTSAGGDDDGGGKAAAGSGSAAGWADGISAFDFGDGAFGGH